LCEINNRELKLDLSWFKNNKDRKYRLNKFNIKEKIATEKEIKKAKRYRKINSRRYFLRNFLFHNEQKYIEEKQFHFDKKIIALEKPEYLIGYWHSEKYFKNYKEVIKKEFKLKTQSNEVFKKTKNKILSSNSISIHFRRGDYVTNTEANKNMGTCSMEYYKRSINFIKKKIENSTFFIFSDDTQWVKDNFNFNLNVVYVSDNNFTEYEELMLMSYCKHNIIANSTFSWWGAWLNSNQNKIIIAPKKWYQNKSRNQKDILPSNWIKL
jgi:hypothetical protein